MTDETPPVIRGLPAFPCPTPACCMCRGTFKDVFSPWVCPHCKAHLSKDDNVCMNLCGLSGPQRRTFQTLMAAAAAKVAAREEE